MHAHWTSGLKVKELVKKTKPILVVELGAGGGENTEQYLELRKNLPVKFKMVVISDGQCPERFVKEEAFAWIFGISYLKLPEFDDGTIDFCSIDTDHNYWTLKQELALLNEKMKMGGIVVLHDTESYRHNSGTMSAYHTGDAYPKEILENQGKGMGDALEEEIAAGNFELIKETKKKCGATAIKKI